jgi:uncharacterized SAM-binding protein YcdF (DUF218 family)
MRLPLFRREVCPCCLAIGLFLAAMLVGGTTFYLACAPILGAFGRWWVVDQPPMKADAIVVLGGDSLDAARVRRAVKIYQQGWAPRIILSGPMLRDDFSEGVLMERAAKHYGAPESALQVVASRADSTVQEKDVILTYAGGQGLHRLLVVTSDYHTRRASAIYCAEAKKRGFEVRIIAAPQSLMARRRWWDERPARKSMLFEFVKFPVTCWELRHPGAASGGDD